jgi:hypothetical protein
MDNLVDLGAGLNFHRDQHLGLQHNQDQVMVHLRGSLEMLEDLEEVHLIYMVVAAVAPGVLDQRLLLV